MPLRPMHRETLHALGDTLFPSLGEGDPAGGDVVPRAFEALHAELPPATQRQLGVALTLFELGALPGHRRRFSALGPAAREAYLASWMRSRVTFQRIVYRSLRELLAMLYYQDPATWPLIAYRGPIVRWSAR